MKLDKETYPFVAEEIVKLNQQIAKLDFDYRHKIEELTEELDIYARLKRIEERLDALEKEL